jgi:hypothetical protein
MHVALSLTLIGLKKFNWQTRKQGWQRRGVSMELYKSIPAMSLMEGIDHVCSALSGLHDLQFFS